MRVNVSVMQNDIKQNDYHGTTSMYAGVLNTRSNQSNQHCIQGTRNWLYRHKIMQYKY